MCLSPGSTRLTKKNRKDSTFYLAQSWRISFIFTQKGDFVHTWPNIFRISGHTDSIIEQRYPSLWFRPERTIVFIYSPCDVQKGDKQINIHYPNEILINQPVAITLEYNRAFNQIKFYIDQVEILPLKFENQPEPNMMCYGKKAVLYLAGEFGEPVNANVENFEYEENLSGEFLGGLSIDQIKNNSCSD